MKILSFVMMLLLLSPAIADDTTYTFNNSNRAVIKISEDISNITYGAINLTGVKDNTPAALPLKKITYRINVSNLGVKLNKFTFAHIVPPNTALFIGSIRLTDGSPLSGLIDGPYTILYSQDGSDYSYTPDSKGLDKSVRFFKLVFKNDFNQGIGLPESPKFDIFMDLEFAL